MDCKGKPFQNNSTSSSSSLVSHWVLPKACLPQWMQQMTCKLSHQWPPLTPACEFQSTGHTTAVTRGAETRCDQVAFHWYWHFNWKMFWFSVLTENRGSGSGGFSTKRAESLFWRGHESFWWAIIKCLWCYLRLGVCWYDGYVFLCNLLVSALWAPLR